MSHPTPDPGRPPRPPFLRRVKIRNYKSLVNCDIELGALTVLVGRNGSGKSNFLDALAFVSDALRISLPQAIDERGGLAVLWNAGRCSEGSGETLGIEICLSLDRERDAVYGFEIAPEWADSAYRIDRERLHVIRNPGGGVAASFRVIDGELVDQPEAVIMPPPSPDRLYLPKAAGLPAFREIYDAIARLMIYNLNPKEMRSLKIYQNVSLLEHDGRNIAGVFGRIAQESPGLKDRITRYLSSVAPGIMSVERLRVGPAETLVFEQSTGDGDRRPPEVFYANSMSDGTLRALGALVAVTPLADRDNPVTLVGIEEPETALHPAAAGILMDALHEAAVQTQIVVTTHSPDLLDRVEFESETDRILVAQSRDGETEIGRIDPASRQILREHLYSPGELLRMDQLEIDRADLERPHPESWPVPPRARHEPAADRADRRG